MTGKLQTFSRAFNCITLSSSADSLFWCLSITFSCNIAPGFIIVKLLTLQEIMTEILKDFPYDWQHTVKGLAFLSDVSPVQ